MTAREALRRAADRPPGEAAAPTIGLIGRDVPPAIVEAAGARPHRLRGVPGTDTSAADAYLGRGLDPAARSLLAGLLTTGFAGLDGIVAGSDSDASQRVFYLLRELRRVDPAAGVPPVHLVDVLHGPSPAVRDYTRDRLAEFRDVLAGWTGRRAGDDDLERALADHEELRRSLLDLAEARRDRHPRFTGSDLLLARHAAGRLPARAARPLVDALRGEPRDEVDGVRIVLSGSDHEEPAVTAAIEAAGALVVADDHGTGELGLDLPYGGGLDGLAARAVADGVTAQRGRIAARAARTADAVRRSAAAGVLVYGRRQDDAVGWDVAAQRRALAVPLETVSGQDFGRIDPDGLRAALAAIGAGR